MFGWNKNCHWSHDWYKWGNPYDVQIRTKLGEGVEQRQKRQCKRCQIVEARDVY